MKIARKLGRDAGWLLLQAVYRSTRGVSIRQIERRARALAAVGWRAAPSRRRLMLSNLALVRPDLSPPEREAVARETTRNIFRGLLELFYLCWHPDELSGFVTLQATAAAKAALRENRGIIVATGHFGLFPLLILSPLWGDRPCAAALKAPHDPRVAQFLTDLRNRFDVASIHHRPAYAAAHKIAALLQRQGVVLFAFDLYPGKEESVPVRFFDRSTLMFSAPVRFAARTGAALTPGYVLRRPDRPGYEARLCDPIETPPEAGRRHSPATIRLVQRLADWMAERIRERPDHWWSIHRRWR